MFVDVFVLKDDSHWVVFFENSFKKLVPLDL